MQMSQTFIDAPLGLVTFKTINKTQMLTKVQISLTPDVYLWMFMRANQYVCVRILTALFVTQSSSLTERGD